MQTKTLHTDHTWNEIKTNMKPKIKFSIKKTHTNKNNQFSKSKLWFFSSTEFKNYKFWFCGNNKNLWSQLPTTWWKIGHEVHGEHGGRKCVTMS